MAAIMSESSIAQPLAPNSRLRAMSSGTIKTFDASQGQGWIRPSDGGHDVHFHLRTLKSPIKALFPGQKITFAVEEEVVGGKNPIAIDVEAEDGHLEPRFLQLGY